MWKWRSINPGMTVRPSTSTMSAPGGIATSAAGPTRTMRSPSMTIRPRSRGAAPVPSTTRAFVMTIARGGPVRAASIGISAAMIATVVINLMRKVAIVLVFLVWAIALLPAAPQQAVVRVWQGTVELPTYLEGPANSNAPFDLFTVGRFNYPYPLRDSLTDERQVVSWRSLHLENE